MLSQEERELLIKTQETIHDATATAKIFGVSKSTVYARIRDYKARGTTELRTNLRGRKSKITSEDKDHIKKLIEKNNDIIAPPTKPCRQYLLKIKFLCVFLLTIR